MITLLEERLRPLRTHAEKYNLLREYLQLLLLRILDERGYFRNLSFVGGTALRILYDLKRFSEDLDFCLINRDNYSFAKMMSVIQYELKLNNLQATIRFKDQKNVASAFIKFEGILSMLGLSNHVDKQLLIKFEVDQNPPNGYRTENTLINKEFLISINHFDLSSLFAGKLHALLCRKYAKGRDYYDFMWYCGRKLKPNLTLLNTAILQTEHKDLALDEPTLAKKLTAHFNTINFKKVAEDVAPFLEDPKEVRHFKKELFLQLAASLQ